MLTIDDFDEFFAALNGGFIPFSWQKELLAFIIENGSWPDQITAPTGSGKSSVVDIHVFANALFALGQTPRVPRRLHTVVNRRSLVDNQYEKALHIQSEIDGATDEGGVLAKARTALKSLRVGSADNSCLSVSLLRGGLSNRSLPVDHPTACAIVSATPDMWGSRSVFHGYGSSKWARPRETALLTMDSALIVDESHISQQLLATARRIRQLQDKGADLGVPHLQVVETTATPTELVEDTDDRSAIGVNLEDTAQPRDSALSKRLNADKTIKRINVAKWNGRPGNNGLVKQALAELDELLTIPERNASLGCIVNHVDTAIKIARALRKKGHNVELLVGRMRPYDLATLNKRKPNLLTTVGDSEVDVVVATQTLEVGVDVDFFSLVTELAPASSLAQRVGRTNRLGRFHGSEIRILQPETPSLIRDEHPPYSGYDLRAAWEWLDALPGGDASPASLVSTPPPASKPRRALLQRLELRDIDLLSRSSGDLAAEPFLELWIRDSLESDPPIGGIVVRELPEDDNAATELLKELSPSDEEVFPASMAVLRKLQLDLLTPSKSKHSARSTSYPHRAFVWSAGELAPVTAEDKLKPGDVLILDYGVSFTSENVAAEDPTDKIPPTPVGDARKRLILNEGAPSPQLKEFFRLATEIDSEELTMRWRETFPEDDKVSITASNSLRQDLRTPRDEVAWLIVEEPEALLEDPEIRQEWTPSQRVYLESHQADVAALTVEMCQKVGIAPQVADAVVVAARHHDDGKADDRFQRMLGNLRNDAPWAKSRKRSKQEIERRRSQSGLPLRWRHEQYSALLMAAQQAKGNSEITDLSLYIAGISHGHGRNAFPHSGVQLVGEGSEHANLALELFSKGTWDSLVQKLNRDYGVYQLAYLSFIERAADAQISKEGR